MTDAGVGLPDREMDVAVAGVPAAHDQRAGGGGQLRDGLEVVRYRGPGHHHVHDVVGPAGLRCPEGPLAGGDELGPGLVGEDVDVDGTEIGDLFGEGLGVLLEPVRLMVLEDDDEVGQGLASGRHRGCRGRCRRWR